MNIHSKARSERWKIFLKIGCNIISTKECIPWRPAAELFCILLLNPLCVGKNSKNRQSNKKKIKKNKNCHYKSTKKMWAIVWVLKKNVWILKNIQTHKKIFKKRNTLYGLDYKKSLKMHFFCNTSGDKRWHEAQTHIYAQIVNRYANLDMPKQTHIKHMP